MRGPTAPGRPIVAMCTSRTAAETAASALKQGCGGWCAVASDPGPWTFGCICRQIAFAHPQVSPQSHKGVRALPSPRDGATYVTSHIQSCLAQIGVLVHLHLIAMPCHVRTAMAQEAAAFQKTI